MWIPVLLVVAILVSYWQFTLVGLALWLVVTCVRRAMEDPRPKPGPLPAVSKPVRAKRVPELPAPGYQSRWTTTRRFRSNREHSEWENAFATLQVARRAGGLH